ncbi:MAG: amidohydrolase [Gemmatimonadota bacterium]|nr:amidohydrolase [Gemmatimonadota bacterium]
MLRLRSPKACLVLVSGLVALPSIAEAQYDPSALTDFIDGHAAEYGEMAQRIWDLAEVGYQEEQSAELLASSLTEAGFEVEMGVAGIPTAFVASWKQEEGPVIGILAEYDALPGITQGRDPTRAPLEGTHAGHACGHHLFAAGSVAAAVATKEWMAATGEAGEIRLYGTPAEEGGAGKVYMVREGLFDDADVVLNWHPGDRNDAGAISTLANKSARFRFSGVSAHAAAAPERGRSALDGVEAMNHMVNLMREHVPQETRIHYVITNGGAAPNVVPDAAEVYYYVRHPDPAEVQSIFDRITAAAEGAALGTGTTMNVEVMHGLYNLLPNVALQEAIHENLVRVGGVTYDEDERAFAERLRESLPSDAPPLESASEVQPFAVVESAGSWSTDVADVSWVVPTGGMSAATWVPGTATHSWQAIAAGGTSIGNKGMIVAAKTLALTAADLLTDPALLDRARAEHRERLPDDWTYEPLLGDRDPPLDYREDAASGGG